MLYSSATEDFNDIHRNQFNQFLDTVGSSIASKKKLPSKENAGKKFKNTVQQKLTSSRDKLLSLARRKSVDMKKNTNNQISNSIQTNITKQVSY